MKTLYVSDLDGTLLRSDEHTSEFTNNTINNLVQKGMLFSYATARSYSTSRKVTEGLNANIPLITFNGTIIVDNCSGELIHKNFFGADANIILEDLFRNDVFPIVYSFIDNVERFSFFSEKRTSGMIKFLNMRQGDKRTRIVNNETELKVGEIFYITCIDKEEKLHPLFIKYKDKYHCVYEKDIYTGEQWLEIMPQGASKANAIKQLKEILGCDYLVVFGDGTNDIDMFEIADESYAVENAVDELKQIATGIIESNDKDGVANLLISHVNK